MISLLRIARVSKSASCTSIFGAVVPLICLACLPGSIWAQVDWINPSGTNTLYSPAQANVGIGTSTPNTASQLTAIGNILLGGSATANWFPYNDSDYIQLKVGSIFLIQSQTTPAFSNLFVVNSSGQVGINTGTPGQCGASFTPPCVLTVNGAMAAKEIIVTTGITADYVFKPDYRLKPLTEVASFIQEHHHLPEIPSEAEVKVNGISVGDMQVKLLAKVEELTLHMIQADEKNNRLERQNRDLRARISRLEARNGKNKAEVKDSSEKR
jgi:hypothetical protein